ncbi:MAG TPA: hypothetical protein VNO55_31700 [Polyangia bacterium]|nr:hypothetical protein [Polyangia bacterium]
MSNEQRKPLTVAELEELERHAAAAGAGVCTVEAAELFELILCYRCMLELGGLVRDFKGPRP